MKNIKTIYEQYQIMPNLQLHMLRVAAVAKIILDHLREPLSQDEEAHIISACLLHDMGNIVKFKLEYFPEFLEPGGLHYWEGVQKDFWQRYGTDQHDVHSKIAQELNVHPRTLELINAIGAKNACANSQSVAIARKICSYADIRVAPHSITSLEERITEAQERYKDRKNVGSDNVPSQIHDCFREIEKQLTLLMNISPEFITEERATPVISSLSTYIPL